MVRLPGLFNQLRSAGMRGATNVAGEVRKPLRPPAAPLRYSVESPFAAVMRVGRQVPPRDDAPPAFGRPAVVATPAQQKK